MAFTGSTHLNGYVYFMLFALLVISPVAIARRIVMSRRVTLRLLVAAICVYLMIGLLFTFVYLGINGVHPSFFAQGPQKDPSIYLYFSFITMTTVGFGDFTPGSSLPRVLVVFEAMLGQVFLVTAVARLVSLYSSESPEPGDACGTAKTVADVASVTSHGEDGGERRVGGYVARKRDPGSRFFQSCSGDLVGTTRKRERHD